MQQRRRNGDELLGMQCTVFANTQQMLVSTPRPSSREEPTSGVLSVMRFHCRSQVQVDGFCGWHKVSLNSG